MLTRTRTRHYPYPPPTGHKPTGHAGWVRVLAPVHARKREHGRRSARLEARCPRKGARCPQCVHLGPERWRRVRCPHTEVVAVDAATAATHRWTGGARGRGVGPGGDGRRGRPHLSGAPSAGGAFVAHTPKSSPLTPPPPPLIGERAVRAVEGSDRVGERTACRPRLFQAGWWRRVRRPHTEVVAVDAATAATHRWTGSARGRGVGSGGERTACCRPRLFQGRVLGLGRRGGLSDWLEASWGETWAWAVA
jgi:hypothetical protein